MEIKAELLKPYGEKEKIQFIVEYNHNLGYEIRETELALEAWGKDTNEVFQATKEAKLNENDTKADEARYNKTFSLELQDMICEFDTTQKTQSDLITAFVTCSSTQGCYEGWVCNNGVVIDLSLEDVVLVSNIFRELTNVYPLWNHYRNLILGCTTVEELNNINIDYDTTLPEGEEID